MEKNKKNDKIMHVFDIKTMRNTTDNDYIWNNHMKRHLLRAIRTFCIFLWRECNVSILV